MSCVYVIMFWCFFFFFKQKTAYEMRISDWSSDVCSSDLQVGQARRVAVLVLLGEVEDPAVHRRHEAVVSAGAIGRPRPVALGGARGAADLVDERLVTGDVDLHPGQRAGLRSEEHTSELQSLMRISYAVFCLKKKTTTKNTTCQQ